MSVSDWKFANGTRCGLCRESMQSGGMVSPELGSSAQPPAERSGMYARAVRIHSAPENGRRHVREVREQCPGGVLVGQAHREGLVKHEVVHGVRGARGQALAVLDVLVPGV